MRENIPTKTITTPKTKTEVVMRQWITGHDDEKIQAFYYDGGTTDPLTGNVRYTAEAMQGADHEMIRSVVVKVGENSDDVVTRVLDLPLVDKKFILDEVKKITSPLELGSSEETTS